MNLVRFARREDTARGQLNLVQDGSGQQPVHYHYLRDGKVDYQDHANGTRTVFSYDVRGLIGSVWHKNNGSGQTLSYRDYWRDDRDRITAWRKSLDASLNPMENGRGDRYSYDEAGQLTLASYQTSNPNGNGNDAQRVDVFTYDALGNRRQDNHLAGHGWMNFTRDDNGLNQYTGWWPYNFIKYDDDIGGEWGAPHAANGVLMQDGWITAGFNALNQPIQIASHAHIGTESWMWFGFDPLGRCVKRWVGPAGASNPATTTFLYYDGWNLLQEGASGANAQRLYIHGARVDEILKSFNYTTGQSAYHHYDARGHCTMLTDPNGDILEQYDYDAFGFPYFFDATGNSLTFYDGPSQSVRGYSPYGNRFLFTGREWLTDLKLYDYRNRMYQPELGRFLQPDPKHFTAGDYNIYRYCGNDPVNKSDPTGLYIEYAGGDEGFWTNWRQQFAERWQNEEFRNWWNNTAVPSRDAYVVGPEGARGSGGRSANPTLPHVMLRAADGRSAAERAQAIPNSSQSPSPNFTHYGYPGDPYTDSGTRLGLGSRNNILNPDSVALSPDQARGVRFGEPVIVNGHFVGFYHDGTAPSLTNRVDIYDPGNIFR